MNVAFSTEDWGWQDGRLLPGGSCWWRVLIPATWLAEQGHTVTVGRAVGHPDGKLMGVAPWDGRTCDLDRCRFDVDVIVMHRCMDARLPDAIRAARQAGQTVVNDVDDWYFGLPTSNHAFAATHKTNSAQENINHYRKVLAASNLVTCSTPYLADRLDGPTATTVVRNAYDPQPWAHVAEHREAYRAALPDGSPPVVGWVGGTPWRSGDLQTLQGILGPWLRRNGWGFYHGGHLDNTPRAADQAGIGDDVSQFTEPFRTVDEYPSLFLPPDVVVVPLSDVPFNMSKSAIRGYECAVSGVPFVASATPEYRWLHDEHGIGRVASKPRQWLRHLDDLRDPDVRADEAERNRAAVKALSITEQGPVWEQVLREAAGA